MTLEADTSHWKRNSDLRIVRVSNPAEMDVFSHVQAKGFAPDQEDYGEWHPWLKEANQRNLENKSQTFYIGYLNNEPIGTTLLVEKNGTAGIYAVATLSEARKQGVGTTLMAEAIVDAKKHACEAVTLQVAQNSYAESLYKKLGFQIRFAAKIFGR
jgi:ribosomal protein S18 acetylase RimI-like enzyme